MSLYLRNVLAALLLLSTQALAQEQPLTTKCESAPLMAAFIVFSETGRMPPNMVKFIGDAASNVIEPYKAFDNVYYVGMRPVSLNTVKAAIRGADSHFVVSGCSCADAWVDSRASAATAFRKRGVMEAAGC